MGIEGRPVNVADIPAREGAREGAAGQICGHVVVEAFAGQPHQHRPRHARMPALSQHGRQVWQRVFVADLNNIRTLSFEDLDDRTGAPRQVGVRHDHPVPTIECRCRRRRNLVDAAVAANILDGRAPTRHDESNVAARNVGGLEQRTVERANAARGRVVRIRDVESCQAHARTTLRAAVVTNSTTRRGIATRSDSSD